MFESAVLGLSPQQASASIPLTTMATAQTRYEFQIPLLPHQLVRYSDHPQTDAKNPDQSLQVQQSQKSQMPILAVHCTLVHTRLKIHLRVAPIANQYRYYEYNAVISYGLTMIIPSTLLLVFLCCPATQNNRLSNLIHGNFRI